MRYTVGVSLSALKDPGFGEESEWRIVVARDLNDDVDSEKYTPFRERIDFFERNSTLVPYVDLFAGSGGPLVVW